MLHGRFLTQHNVAILEQCYNCSTQCRNNVATLCCANNRRCESSRLTSPIRSNDVRALVLSTLILITVKFPRSCKGKDKFYSKANFFCLGSLEVFELHLQFSCFLPLQIGAIDVNRTRVRKMLGVVGLYF